MADWRRERLGDHAKIGARIGWRGLSADEYVESGPFLIAGKHIASGSVDWVRCDHLTEDRYRESPEIALQVGDVIISKDGTIGRVARIDSLPGPATLNGTMMLVRPTGSLEYRYLSHLLNGSAFKQLVEERISGSSVPHLFQRDLVTLPVNLPLLEEQRQIAEILDMANETIRATERVIAKHAMVRAGLARDLLTESSSCLPRHGLDQRETGPQATPAMTSTGSASDEVLLKDCGHWLSGGTPDTSNPDFWGGEIPWITASSLKSRYLRTSVRRLTPAGAKAGTRVVPPQTILFVVRGMSLKKEFRVGITVRPVAFGQDCKALVPADGVDPKYLLFALEAAENHVLKMVDEATHGTGRLQTSLLGSLKVWLPPLDHQRRITAILETIDGAIQANVEQLGKLRQLRSGLATDLLSGQVRTVAA